MSGSVRQSELFTAEDWRVLYRAFSMINFNSSDPASINQAIVGYLQTNYPENFNDWTENSEFVALIDLLSWLAGNLAFKTDLAVRENFIDTAEARSSILRLARFLSYNPSRNRCATGIVKIVQLQTDDTLFDSDGVNLANTPIIWNNPNDRNWQERFTLVLNNALIGTNPYGVPIKQGTVVGQPMQLYMLNTSFAQQSVGFSATVAANAMGFEICNGDFQDQGTLVERTPNPNDGFCFYHMEDGNGAASARTGFFMLFKQGSTGQQTFTVSTPVQNQVLNVSSAGINQTDVWVQTVDDDGSVLTDWTMVPIMLDSNTTFNALPIAARNIYSVLTGDQDQIALRFSDGQFGNAPVGLIRATYRVSNGLAYQINPHDIDQVTLRLGYTNPGGVQKTLLVTFSLFDTVSNAATAETIEQVRQRAPMVYGTQNRMVSGEDYNGFPLQTNIAIKLKALNRVYSGQSRYIDLQDPTGTYKDLSIFADDGIFFKEPAVLYTELPSTLNLSAAQIIAQTVQPALRDPQTSAAAYDVFMQALIAGTLSPALPGSMTWTQATGGLFSSTGNFNVPYALVQPGAMIQFQTSTGTLWAAVETAEAVITRVPTGQTAGPVSLSIAVPTGATVLGVLPAFTPTLPISAGSIGDTIAAQLTSRLSFSLAFDYVAGGWVVNAPMADLGAATLNGTALTMLTADYLAGLWRITTRGLRYVFESVASVEWYDDGSSGIDAGTGDAGLDQLRVLRFNRDPNQSNGTAFARDYSFALGRIWTYANGVADPRRTTLALLDANADGYPDDPDVYYRLTDPAITANYLFWQRLSDDVFVTPCATMTVYETATLLQMATPAIGSAGFLITGTNALDNESFWTYTSSGWARDFSGTYSFARGRGANVAASWVGSSTPSPFGDALNFQWKHYAPSTHRIDPASSNIIDIFVLTADYDSAVRQWIANGALAADQPTPPSELDLALAFAGIESAKTFSDTIVWRPVSYKFLFGVGADPAVQGVFKVVPATGTTVSNGEIQSRVINAINVFFQASKWDFGETFYFTELAAYIHQQLAGIISSVVLVPLNAASAFGNDFEITSRPDQIFVSTAQVANVMIIASNTPGNLRIR